MERCSRVSLNNLKAGVPQLVAQSLDRPAISLTMSNRARKWTRLQLALTRPIKLHWPPWPPEDGRRLLVPSPGLITNLWLWPLALCGGA